MTPTPVAYIRRATPNDARALWEWRNDPQTRANSRTGDVVPWDAHVAWLQHVLASETVLLLVLEVDGRPVAQTRYDRDDGGEHAEVSITVAPHERGRGYGAQALAMGMPLAAQALRVRTLHAYVKRRNEASLRLFERAGFQRPAAGSDAAPAAHTPSSADSAGARDADADDLLLLIHRVE